MCFPETTWVDTVIRVVSAQPNMTLMKIQNILLITTSRLKCYLIVCPDINFSQSGCVLVDYSVLSAFKCFFGGSHILQ